MPEDLGGEKLAQEVDTVSGHPPYEYGQSLAVPESPPISLISHPTKVMLGIILNQLKI
ncbi:hypothetical protein DPMN_160512 [Dreissena polymorpha]|uniref:Uncharacterized protein n=1 Tax=Dreissena polymorpha TaxID=45954 RepID=A0A9D4ER88_DREPO|nr:hypothetical protein DPMN_160512 [Dreissena polymorpha]